MSICMCVACIHAVSCELHTFTTHQQQHNSEAAKHSANHLLVYEIHMSATATITNNLTFAVPTQCCSWRCCYCDFFFVFIKSTHSRLAKNVFSHNSEWLHTPTHTHTQLAIHLYATHTPCTTVHLSTYQLRFRFVWLFADCAASQSICRDQRRVLIWDLHIWRAATTLHWWD